MRSRNASVCVINTMVVIIFSLILLSYTFWDASHHLTANWVNQLELQMKDLATLEADYVKSCLSGIQADLEEAGVDAPNHERLILSSLNSLLSRQNTSQRNYNFHVLSNAAVAQTGFIPSTSDSGTEQYTYYLSVPGSNLVVAVSAAQPAYEAYANQCRRTHLVFAFRVLGVCVILVIFARFDLRRRLKKLVAANERLRISGERFRVAVAHTAYMVFEYDLCSGMIRFLNESTQFSHLLSCMGQEETELWKELIHPNDLPSVIAIKEQLASGQLELSLVLRARVLNKTPEYRWCRLTLTAISNSSGQAQTAVGTLADIDEQQTETITLRRKAECDSLTGLFNREECERRVERVLAENNREHGGVFLLMDMDDFKSLNDRMGHLSGDAALRTLASVIRQVFRDSDISGRMGGDEFMVWLRDVTDVALVERKLAELKEALQLNTHKDHMMPHLLLSIGVVFARKGDHFLALYNMADIALYQAKKEGRNRHVYYKRDEGMAILCPP